MNKRGMAVFYLLMIGIVFFVLGMALAPAIGQVSGEAMNHQFLNCTTTSDAQTKTICTSIDLFQPVFTGVLFGLAAMLVGAIATR